MLLLSEFIRVYTAVKTLLTDRDLYQLYDQHLNQAYPDCIIAGKPYDTAHALKEIDVVTYRRRFNDWLDKEIIKGSIIENNDEYHLV